VDRDEAIQLFRLFPVDVVVMDCRFCDPSNPLSDPAAVLKRQSPNVPIIMMSSYCRAPCRRMLNADACIEKGGKWGAFKTALMDRDWAVRAAAAKAIGQLGRPGTEKWLEFSLDDRKPGGTLRGGGQHPTHAYASAPRNKLRQIALGYLLTGIRHSVGHSSTAPRQGNTGLGLIQT